MQARSADYGHGGLGGSVEYTLIPKMVSFCFFNVFSAPSMLVPKFAVYSCYSEDLLPVNARFIFPEREIDEARALER